VWGLYPKVVTMRHSAIVEPVGKPHQFSLLIVVATQCWTACGLLASGATLSPGERVYRGRRELLEGAL
jgi:hypothetical protein